MPTPAWRKILISGSNAHVHEITSSGIVTTPALSPMIEEIIQALMVVEGEVEKEHLEEATPKFNLMMVVRLQELAPSLLIKIHLM